LESFEEDKGVLRIEEFQKIFEPLKALKKLRTFESSHEALNLWKLS
jgi:hypothetical protein